MAFFWNSLVGIQEYPQTSRIEQFPKLSFAEIPFIPRPDDS